MTASAQRPNQKPHDLDQYRLVDPNGLEHEKRVQWRGLGEETTPGSVPKSRETSVDPQRDR